MPTEVDQLDRLKSALADRYHIHSELGRGGMATVYLAEEPRHDRRLALKVLHPHLAATLGTGRFLREIKTTAGLTHPHILPLFDSGEADGFLYYTMPYVDGESLRARLAREPQLPIDEAIRITREIADAVGFAHNRGLLHRDIKPENVLFEAGHAVVADFGIAKAVADASEDSLTATGLALGTPQYMSPEQAGGGQRLDCRTDMYSLACVLYEMLTGDPPFAGSLPQAIFARKAIEAPAPIRHVRERVTPEVEAAVARALAKVPADRFRTVQEFVDALAVVPGLPTVDVIHAPGGPSEEPSTLRAMPLELRPLERELDCVGLTHPGKVHRASQGSFLISSIGRYMHVHDTSLSNTRSLPKEGERQAFFAIIADGVGRDTWGGEAARIAIEVLSQYCIHGIRCYHTGDDEHDRALVMGIHEAVGQARANVVQRARGNSAATGMSAALSMFLGSWPRAYVLLDGRNHCYRFLDDDLAEVGGDAGLGELLAFDSESTTRGSRHSKSLPAVYRLENSWRAVYLLCNDAIPKCVSRERIKSRLALSSCKQACEDLLQDALEAGGEDSVTLIVGCARPDPHA